MRFRLICFVFLISLSTKAQEFSERKIKRMLKKIPAFQQAHVALSVEPLNSLKPKAFYQGENYMTPASNIKLLTFLAAIQNFDSLPALYFNKQDSIMHFKATGYPLLLHPFYPDPKLDFFFNQKYNWCYHPPKSTLNRLGEGWSWDDYHYYYSAENSPFPIYGNTTRVTLVSCKPQLIPKAFEKNMVLDTLSKKLYRKRSQNLYHLNPRILNKKDTLYIPFITSDSLFISLLGDHINRSVEQSKALETPPNWNILFSNQEAMLYQAMLQDSDNGVAESLLTMISQNNFEEMNIEKIIDSLKLKWSKWLPDPIQWVDGSGISRYNMMTPRTLIAVLKKIHSEVGFENIKNFFPKSGSSGTLKNYPVKEVYAKTGTLRHNHNLSGYWISKKGNIYVFSIMANHFTTPISEIRHGITELLTQFQKRLK
ncbi:MAG: hypothetical protein CBD31_00580 [Flavobacteriaceae bacterium TMED171]|nr:hypothetical protein [Flavobacteriaceae bacterium]OUW33545.1 MAG: hypothetical protein CBD31_00580 [Flavobacteriaceae bacterium TMED171]